MTYIWNGQDQSYSYDRPCQNQTNGNWNFKMFSIPKCWYSSPHCIWVSGFLIISVRWWKWKNSLHSLRASSSVRRNILADKREPFLRRRIKLRGIRSPNRNPSSPIGDHQHCSTETNNDYFSVLC